MGWRRTRDKLVDHDALTIYKVACNNWHLFRFHGRILSLLRFSLLAIHSSLLIGVVVKEWLVLQAGVNLSVRLVRPGVDLAASHCAEKHGLLMMDMAGLYR